LIDPQRVAAMLQSEGLDGWAAMIGDQLDHFFRRSPHGDWSSWRDSLARLPRLQQGSVDVQDGAVRIVSDALAGNEATLRDALMRLHPWRKGPYQIGDLRLDTEWRSDWKWQRVAPQLQALDGRLVLDVGCGNGYHCWRTALAGARRVIGIDPTALFLAQFLALRSLIGAVDPQLARRVELLPLGIEDLPAGLGRFDTVFSMGVLYHRRSPIDHLLELRGALRSGGQLVLETLVIEGGEDALLVPRGRYAKMRNVWFIPSVAQLETWLHRAGFARIEVVDVTVTSVEEQRATAWMTFESLADFLDPADSSKTIEGHPAPRRAVVVAEPR
jgi:tRNA (mo5U34)-methyltransferase